MSFDRLAPHYDWMEAVLAGGTLQRMRTAWLDRLSGCRRILSVGEGHGRFAAACAARFPSTELTVLDASPAMLARARQRIPPTARVHWVTSELGAWEPRERYDAIVTCFFLDCFPPDQLAAAIARLAAAAEDDAIWLVSDFAVPERGLARWRARAIHAAMYGFFRVATRLPARRLTAPDDLLAAHGFSLQGRRESDWGLLRADYWSRSRRER